MGTLLHDVRAAARSLRRRPFLPTLLVLVVAVGVGFLTTTYAIFDAILWKPLEIGSPGRYAMVGEVARGGSGGQMPTARVDLFAAYDSAHAEGRIPSAEVFIPVRETEVNLAVNGVASSETATWLLPRTMPHLESKPLLGRYPSDGADGSRPREIAIGEGIWERRFNRRDNVLGALVAVNGDSAVVVGVMPRRFQFHRMSELWVAWPKAELLADPSASVRVVVKLAPGSSGSDLARETSPIGRTVFATRTPPDTLRNGHFSNGPFGSALVPPQLARLILGMTSIVLVAAFVNLATLFLVRVRGRTGEFATLAALGAGRSSILRRVTAEIALVMVAGGILALAVSRVMIGWISASLSGVLPAWVQISIDPRSFAVTSAVLLWALLLVAYPVARLAGRLDLSRLLAHTGVIGGSPKHTRGTSALIATQVAVVVFLAAATLPIAHSAIALSGVRSGLDEDRVVTVQVNLAGELYEQHEGRDLYVTGVRASLTADSRIEGVAMAGGIREWHSGTAPAYSRNWYVEGRPDPLPFLATYRAFQRVVSHDYFDVVGLRLVAGERFGGDLDAADERVAVISRSVAERYWPGESAVGRRFAVGEAAPWITVIGVVENEDGIFADWRGTTFEPHMSIYLSDAQASISLMKLYVRVDRATPEVMASIEQAVAAVDPMQSVWRVRLLADELGVEKSFRKWFAIILGSGVVVALLLAGMGVYGVVTYYTAVRLRELALRVALGARLRAAAWLVARETLRSVSRGSVFGVLFLLVCARPHIARFEYETSVFSPLVLLCVALLVLAVAGCAVAVPLLRLRRVSPHELLRSE